MNRSVVSYAEEAKHSMQSKINHMLQESRETAQESNNGSKTLLELILKITNKMLCNRKREDQLGSHNQQLWSQSFEQPTDAFILNQPLEDCRTRFRRVERSVLNTSLNNVEWLRHRNRRRGTDTWRNGILSPRGTIALLSHAHECLCGGIPPK